MCTWMYMSISIPLDSKNASHATGIQLIVVFKHIPDPIACQSHIHKEHNTQVI